VKSIRYIKFVFFIIFLLALYLPVITFDWISKESKSEKRNLAKLPTLFKSGTKLNYNFLSEVDEFIGDRFGLRKYFVMFNAEIKYKILRDKGNNRVAIGKNGWLYLISEKSNNFNDLMKNNVLDKNSLNKAVNSLKNRAQWCKKNNIKFIFLICPEKHSIYPEYLPIKRPEGITLREQFTAELEKNGIDYIDPTSYLLKIKKDIPLYYKTDSHWNNLGAYYAFLLLKEKIEKQFPKVTFPSYKFETQIVKTKGPNDLTELLGIANYEHDADVIFSYKKSKLENIYNSKDIISNIDDNLLIESIFTAANGAPVKAVIFRDSFFIALGPFVYPMFSNTYTKWIVNNLMMEEKDKELILKEKPDIVIYEMAERRLINFCDDNYLFNA
jgi:hypothetical protein